MSLGLLEYFDLLSLVYDLGIPWFSRFYLSSTSKKVFEHFLSSSYYMMLAQSLKTLACLFSN